MFTPLPLPERLPSCCPHSLSDTSSSPHPPCTVLASATPLWGCLFTRRPAPRGRSRSDSLWPLPPACMGLGMEKGLTECLRAHAQGRAVGWQQGPGLNPGPLSSCPDSFLYTSHFAPAKSRSPGLVAWGGGPPHVGTAGDLRTSHTPSQHCA